MQHYLVTSDGEGGFEPAASWMNLPAIEAAADRYAATHKRAPRFARARLLSSVARHCLNRDTFGMLTDLFRMQHLLHDGMNLARVPPRFLLLGFITACDPHNFDAQVAVNCGKGELSVDGGFTESSAVANVQREARFERSREE